MKEWKRAGVIGRFKPLHLGGAVMLEAICEQAEQVVIGLGSANKYNVRNPFTVEESAEMIQTHLSPNFSNYELIQIPDFAQIAEYSDGQRWKEFVTDSFGELDCFFSGNDYVRGLLKEDYQLIYPATIISPEKRIKIRGTEVRIEIARYGDWQELVPERVADYLESNGLVERFRKEFGLETLATTLNKDYCRSETAAEEYKHTLEVG